MSEREAMADWRGQQYPPRDDKMEPRTFTAYEADLIRLAADNLRDGELSTKLKTLAFHVEESARPASAEPVACYGIVDEETGRIVGVGSEPKPASQRPGYHRVPLYTTPPAAAQDTVRLDVQFCEFVGSPPSGETWHDYFGSCINGGTVKLRGLTIAALAARPASAEPVAGDLFSGRPLNRTEVMDFTRMHSAIRVGQGLLDARLALGMTQAEVARISGTTQAHVSMVEAAERNATLDVLSRMARAVGMVVTLAPALEQTTPPAAAQDTEGDVKAGMVRRMNAMHEALSALVDAFRRDSNNRYVVGATQAYSSPCSLRLTGEATVDVVRNAQRALSQEAYTIDAARAAGGE